MVRFKSRWVLFQVSADPIIENGVVVYPKSQLALDEKLISRHIFQSVEENYGEFGKGQGSVSGELTRSQAFLISYNTNGNCYSEMVQLDNRNRYTSDP